MNQPAERITNGANGNDQLLYFTTLSLNASDEKLWFISDRTGDPNVFCQDLKTGKTTQLTKNSNGRLWQYQGFGGNIGKGLGVWSMALDESRNILYTICDHEILAIDDQGVSRVLAKVDEDQTTAFIDVSSCGNWLCVPTTDRAALGAPVQGDHPSGKSSGIDQRCQDLGLNSFLNIYRTGTGKRERKIAVPRAWITHVQFHPSQPEWVLYNHEWSLGDGNRRMWLWDGHRHTCLRPKSELCSDKDWISHEVWSPRGDFIYYHGAYFENAALLGRFDLAAKTRIEIKLPEGWKRYGHFFGHPTDESLMVSDGYYQTDDDDAGKGRWLSIQKINWEKGEIRWIPICRHRSSWKSQDDHPHPIFDHRGKFIYFTGGTPDGGRAVYRVEAPQILE